MTTPTSSSSSRRALLTSLFTELFQTEESCREHCAREARRENVGPRYLDAMWALSEQGARNLRDARAYADARDIDAEVGRGFGALFSNLREYVADRALSAERSWRMTLTGLRHGLDVYAAVRAVAVEGGDAVLVAWCDAPTAAHPEAALQRARRLRQAPKRRVSLA